MTPEQKIKREILCLAYFTDVTNYFDYSNITGEQVDVLYEKFAEEEYYQEWEEEFRCGYDEETRIDPQYSRNYESKYVAKNLQDGSWVGYTYWYGGGKHANSENLPWMQDACNILTVPLK